MSEKLKKLQKMLELEGAIAMVDEAAGISMDRVPWWIESHKLKKRAKWTRLDVLFSATPDGRIFTGLMLFKRKSQYNLTLRLRPSELRRLGILFTDVAKEADDLIQMVRMRQGVK